MTQKSIDNMVIKEQIPSYLGKVQKIIEIKNNEEYEIEYSDYFTQKNKKIKINFKIQPQIINNYIIRISTQQLNDETKYVLEVLDEKKFKEYSKKTKKQDLFKTQKATEYGCFLRYINPID